MDLSIKNEDIQDIIKYNKSINESEWWVKEELLQSAFSSYYYYDDLLQQICSIFRGLIKNHPFSNANKRTGAMFLSFMLKKYGYYISDEDLIDITLDVSQQQYNVKEISDKVLNVIYKI